MKKNIIIKHLGHLDTSLRCLSSLSELTNIGKYDIVHVTDDPKIISKIQKYSTQLKTRAIFKYDSEAISYAYSTSEFVITMLDIAMFAVDILAFYDFAFTQNDKVHTSSAHNPFSGKYSVDEAYHYKTTLMYGPRKLTYMSKSGYHNTKEFIFDKIQNEPYLVPCVSRCEENKVFLPHIPGSFELDLSV